MEKEIVKFYIYHKSTLAQKLKWEKLVLPAVSPLKHDFQKKTK